MASKYRENGPGSGSTAAILPPGAGRGENLIEIKQRAENRDKLTEWRVGRKSANRKMAYLNLRFWHAQSVGQLRPLRTRKVLCLLKSFLKRKNLLPRERGPRVLLLALLVIVTHVWNKIHLVRARNTHSHWCQYKCNWAGNIVMCLSEHVTAQWCSVHSTGPVQCTSRWLSSEVWLSVRVRGWWEEGRGSCLVRAGRD